MPRLAEIVSDANVLQKKANAIEITVSEIKEDIDRRMGEILALLPRDGE